VRPGIVWIINSECNTVVEQIGRGDEIVLFHGRLVRLEQAGLDDGTLRGNALAGVAAGLRTGNPLRAAGE
jgi:hypothetical protein